MKCVTLAIEDQLSESVGIRLAGEAGLEVNQTLKRNGSGYLRSRIPAFCQMAQVAPVFLITDLDAIQRPEQLEKLWFGERAIPGDLIFSIAIREIESWLLADHDAIGQLFGKKAQKLPALPDELPDPKSELLRLASKAPKAVRVELVAERDSMASQGLGYNATLGAFVQNTWQPNRAASRSPSLAKTRIRLSDLARRM